MSIRLVVDMNLSPEWIPELAPAWVRRHGFVVFTHDLDYGAILGLTHADGPSVLQVRGQNVLPTHLAGLVVAALRQHDAALAAGAIVVVDERKSRVRILPL